MNIPYPQILKNADWQKEKSLIPKVLPGKKTGIGEAMQECERGHAALAHALAAVDPLANITQSVRSLAATIGLSMLDLKMTAEDAAKKWSAKTSPVPKNTRLHAEQIAHAADQYHHAIRTLLAL